MSLQMLILRFAITQGWFTARQASSDLMHQTRQVYSEKSVANELRKLAICALVSRKKSDAQPRKWLYCITGAGLEAFETFARGEQ